MLKHAKNIFLIISIIGLFCAPISSTSNNQHTDASTSDDKHWLLRPMTSKQAVYMILGMTGTGLLIFLTLCHKELTLMYKWRYVRTWEDFMYLKSKYRHVDSTASWDELKTRVNIMSQHEKERIDGIIEAADTRAKINDVYDFYSDNVNFDLCKWNHRMGKWNDDHPDDRNDDATANYSFEKYQELCQIANGVTTKQQLAALKLQYINDRNWDFSVYRDIERELDNAELRKTFGNNPRD